MTNLEISDVLEKYSKEIKKICLYFYRRNPKILLTIEDYYQEASLAIIGAMDKYNPDKGKLISYISSVVVHRLSKYAAMNNSNLKVTPEIVQQSTQIFSLRKKGLDEKEICKTLNIEPESYYKIAGVLTRGYLGDFMNIPELDTIEMDLPIILSFAELEVVNSYRAGNSTKETAQNLVKSEEYVRKLLHSAVGKIQAYLAE